MSSPNIMRTVIILLFFTTFNLISAKSIKAKSRLGNGCTINLKSDVHKKQPPMLISQSSGLSYQYPSTLDPVNLQVAANASLSIFCPGKSNRDSSATTEAAAILHGSSVLKKARQPVPIVCKSGKSFQVAGKTVGIADISCEEQQHASYSAILRRHSERPKCANGERYEIGYEVGKANFLRTLELCHARKEAKTLWAHAVIEPANSNANRYSGDRQSFKTGVLYENMHMSKLDPYSLLSAHKTVETILGGEGAADKYTSNKITDRKFLAKGHLIASADKLYKSEQDSTMFYANVVPMWQQVNANPGHWFLVEEYVRHLAFHKNHRLAVWAGGVGLLKLEGKEIHLYRERSAKGLDLRLPVPKVLYKCVVDEASKEALCFLVVNNPYAKKSELGQSAGEYSVCQSLETCDKITPHFDEPSKGYFYCCELRDFYAKNHKELGLEDLKAYASFGKMQLLTNDKLHEPIPWSMRDEKRGGKKTPGKRGRDE